MAGGEGGGGRGGRQEGKQHNFSSSESINADNPFIKKCIWTFRNGSVLIDFDM